MPRDEATLNQYSQYPKITEIFPLNSVGIVTSRDEFVIDFDKNALKRRIMMFRNANMPDEIIHETFGLKDKTNWKLKQVRERVIQDREWEDSLIKIIYRPFNSRWIFYHDEVIEHPRREVMRHMMQENLGLVTVRQVAEGIFNHAFVADCIIESRVTLSNKGIAFIFPLYLYQFPSSAVNKRGSGGISGKTMMLFESEADYSARRPNLSPPLLEALHRVYNKKLTPEEIFYYIYAVLYSNIYRTKYAEFLKIDFPVEDHKMMQDMMSMMKEMMGMMRDFSHNPSATQKKRLGEMMEKMDEMMKMHDEMMKERMDKH